MLPFVVRFSPWIASVRGASSMLRPRPAFGTIALVASLVATAMVTSTAAAQAPVASGARRVDGVVAFVGGTTAFAGVEVILLSDVELRARMHLAATELRPNRSLPPELLAATLEELVGEALIAREAERLRIATPTARDYEEARAGLEQIAGGATSLGALVQALGVQSSEMETIIARRAVVHAFLEANLRGAELVTDAAVERTYQSGDHPFAERPLEEVRELLRALLVRQAVKGAVQHWVTVLRARIPVRIVAEWR